MKEIKAYVRPQMLDPVVDALETRPGMPGVTVVDVRGFGHVEGGGPVQLTERVKLEIVVPDAMADEVVDTIVEEARTGSAGDGNVFVSDVADAVRIRTGERGETAVRRSRPAEDMGEGPEDGGVDR